MRFYKLEYLRKKYRLTQKDMAKLLGLCESSYNHKVNGVTPWFYDEMITIMNELNKRAERSGSVKLKLDDIFIEE